MKLIPCGDVINQKRLEFAFTNNTTMFFIIRFLNDSSNGKQMSLKQMSTVWQINVKLFST